MFRNNQESHTVSKKLFKKIRRRRTDLHLDRRHGQALQNKQEFQKERGKNTTTQKEGGGRQHHQKKRGERSTSKRKSRPSNTPKRGEGNKAQPPKRREEKAASLEKRTQHHTEGRGRTTTSLCSHPLLGWCCSLPSFLPWVWCCFSTPPRGRGLPLSSFFERCCFPSTWRGVRDGPLSLWVVMPSPPFFWVVLLSSLPSSFLWWFQNILKNENLFKEDENIQRKQEGISQREREKVALPKDGGRKRHHRKKEHTAQVCLLFNWTWLEKNNIIRRLKRTLKKKHGAGGRESVEWRIVGKHATQAKVSGRTGRNNVAASHLFVCKICGPEQSQQRPIMGPHAPCWQTFAVRFFFARGPSHFCGARYKTL